MDAAAEKRSLFIGTNDYFVPALETMPYDIQIEQFNVSENLPRPLIGIQCFRTKRSSLRGMNTV